MFLLVLGHPVSPGQRAVKRLLLLLLLLLLLFHFVDFVCITYISKGFLAEQIDE